MRKISILTLSAAVSLSVAGCIATNLAEINSVMRPDATEIVAEAEFLPGTSDSTKVIVIRSNRSWFAHLNDVDNPIDVKDPLATVPWGRLDVESHSNLTNVTEEVPVTIIFKRNYTQQAINGVLNIYSEGKMAASIPVRQNGAVYHLSASAEESVAQCDGDTLSLKVNCNTAWTAAVAEDSQADLKLDISEGFDPGELKVIFDENFDVSKKSAAVILKAKDCDDVRVEFSQNEASPYFYVLEGADPRVIAGDGEASVLVRSNSAWTASVAESELGNFQIVNASGVSGIRVPQEVKVKFTPNQTCDPKDIKKAKIRFSVSGMESPVEFTFTQRGLLKITMDQSGNFSPALPSGNPSYDEQWYTYGYTDNEKIDVSFSKYMYLGSSPFLYVYGAGKRPCVRFGGVDGLKLKKISLELRRMSDTDYEGDARNCFCAIIRTSDHVYGEDGRANTIEKNLTEYKTVKWTGGAGLYTYEFNLEELEKELMEGEGCVIQFSDQSGHGDLPRRTQCFIKSFILRYY